MYSGEALQYYLLTGRRQSLNDSCQWSFEPTPLLFNWNFSLHIPPPSCLALSPLGFTSFEPLGQRPVDLPGRHGNSSQHQMSRELPNNDDGRQRAVLYQPHFLLGNRGSRTEGERSLFVKHTLSFFGLGLSLKCWAGGGRGILVFMEGVLRACWGPSQACTVGCWGSEQSRGLVVSWACSWAVTVSNWLRSTHNCLKAHWPTLSFFLSPLLPSLISFFPSAKLRQWPPHGLFHWTVWSNVSHSFLQACQFSLCACIAMGPSLCMVYTPRMMREGAESSLM